MTLQSISALQPYADVLFAVKGSLGVVATALLIYHMDFIWPRLESKSQRMRYIALLLFSIQVTGASAEQITDPTQHHVGWAHLGSMAVMIYLIVTTVFSIKEDRKRNKHD